jgi:general secretion pathway protein C
MNAVTSWLDAMHAPDKWPSTLRSRAPQIAVWVLALALGVQAAMIVAHLAGAGRPVLPTVQPAPAVQRQHVDVAAITRAHLFGAAPAARAESAANAPPTSMALVLTATFAVHDRKDGHILPDQGVAILGPNATATQVYGVGDNVPGGARLHAVYDDRVVLDRNGSLETLLLPRQVSGAPGPAVAATPPSDAAERVRHLITDDPGAIADVIRPQPVFAGGKQRGYRVYPGRNRQAFLRLGLRPGDLVTAINNTPLDDPSRGEEIFSTLGSSSEAHVTVMRNGRQQDLTLNMSQVASEADQLSGGQSQPGVPGPNGPPGAGLPGPGASAPPGRD